MNVVGVVVGVFANEYTRRAAHSEPYRHPAQFVLQTRETAPSQKRAMRGGAADREACRGGVKVYGS